MRLSETQKRLLKWAVNLGGSIIITGPNKDARVGRGTIDVAHRLHLRGMVRIAGGAEEMRAIVTYEGYKQHKLRGRLGRPFAAPTAT